MAKKVVVSEEHGSLVQLADVSKKGCPQCATHNGSQWVVNKARSCACKGQIRLFEWFKNEQGEWLHLPQLVKN
jgi:hypothetical protein